MALSLIFRHVPELITRCHSLLASHLSFKKSPPENLKPTFVPTTNNRETACYLYFAEDQLVPQAVVSNDATAQLSFFPLGGEVQEPPLQRGVCLPENLRSQERRRCHNS